MIQNAIAPLTLEEFLKLPETQPTSEFIDGKIRQKPMPQGEHSRLHYKLCSTINQVAETAKIACAFPELRCSFGDSAIVPDVTVFRWNRIPFNSSRRITNRFSIHPDWSIEILSPGQSQTNVLGNLLYCSQHGTEIGWLIDPEEESILTIDAQQKIQLLRSDRALPILPEIELSLTVAQVLSWLTFG